MAKYIIQGGVKLKGNVYISGNKNALFPCIAAGLLTPEGVTLRNVPAIADLSVMRQILHHLGIQTEYQDHTLRFQAHRLSTHKIPKDLNSKLRGSIVIVGALLGRLGKAEFSHPGGDIIGKRSIDIHLEVLKKIGYQFSSNDTEYKGWRKDEHDAVVFLPEASVTTTENLILSSVLGKKTTILKNCAKEPHVVDLCNMLTLMGAQIKGIEDSTLIISGVEQLSGVDFSLGFDYIEFGTYAILSALTGGELKLLNCSLQDMDPLTQPLSKMGLNFEQDSQAVSVKVKNIEPLLRLTTNVWPGFPTDLMSVLIVLATQAKGVSLLHDWMYESRMFFVDKLIGMGAQITIADPHRVVVYGPSSLRGRELETPDIRAGMALVLAALITKGESIIYRSELIERGYENVVETLIKLGAKIEKVV